MIIHWVIPYNDNKDLKYDFSNFLLLIFVLKMISYSKKHDKILIYSECSQDSLEAT